MSIGPWPGWRPSRLALAMGAVALWTFAMALPAIGARASYGARVTADEPQYLTTAISIGEDFDLDISDELAERRFEPFHETDLNPQTVHLDDSGRRVSPHDPLLPALLAVPMRLGGWVAAKATLAALAGATAAATLWLAVRRFAVPVGLGALLVGGFFAAPPLTAYATQVYPEMPAALCLTLGLGAVTGPLQARGRAVLLLSVVALPWLSVKYAPVAVVLVAALAARTWRGSRRRLAVDLAILAAAGVVYLVSHRAVYGGWTAYASGDHFVDGELLVLGRDPDYAGRSRRLVGLLVDRGFGLAAWTPAYLLVVPALAALARRRPPGWSVLVAAFGAGYAVATWAALTMHGWWWPGRQLVVVLPVAVVAVAVLAGRSSRLLWPSLAGCAVGILNWLWLVVESSTGHRTLVTDFEPTSNPVYRAWRVLLPDHRDFDATAVSLTVVWALVLAATGVWAALRARPEPDGDRPAAVRHR
ncbi:MAG: hypothetical protein OXC06_10130 [Acidimicrobiaceae bacterium]|nr:hypothetical protein [Acidimicrobiaceae bacterium]